MRCIIRPLSKIPMCRINICFLTYPFTNNELATIIIMVIGFCYRNTPMNVFTYERSCEHTVFISFFWFFDTFPNTHDHFECISLGAQEKWSIDLVSSETFLPYESVKKMTIPMRRSSSTFANVVEVIETINSSTFQKCSLHSNSLFSVAGICLNAVLLYAIMKFSRPILGTYKHLLTIFALLDAYLVILHLNMHPVGEMFMLSQFFIFIFIISHYSEFYVQGIFIASSVIQSLMTVYDLPK